ncbi:MAG: hypothetical protein WD492_06975 [Alkalispirochaeta sp.]
MPVTKRNCDSVEQIKRRIGRLDGAYENVADIPPAIRHRMITEHIKDHLDGLSTAERETLDKRIREILAGPLAERNAWYRGDYDHADWNSIVISQAVSEVRIFQASGKPLPDPPPWWSRYITTE